METKKFLNKGFILPICLSILVCISLLMPVAAIALCDPPVKIMPVGDSITDEYNVPGSYRKPLYESLVVVEYNFDFVGSQHDGQLPDPDHEGYSGKGADWIRDRIYGFLTANPPEIVLLHIGTNDINGGQSAAGVAAEIGQILDNIDAWEDDNNADIWVILARIVNWKDPTDAKGLETTELNNQIQSLADARIITGDKIIVVDMENALTYPEDMADLVHPNASGYEKMADVWYTALSNFLPVYCSDGPAVNDLTLTSSSGQNLLTDDLTCSFDLSGSATTSATAWRRNSTGLMALYMPMEGGETNGLKDFSGNDVPVTTAETPTWSPTAGHNGNGAFVFNENDVLNAALSFPTLSSYSQTAWVQKAANDTWQNIISGTIYEHLLLAESGILKCGHNELISLADTVPLTNGEWYHVAVTFHYGSGELILYKNGSPVASKIVDAAKKDMTNAQTFIGRSGGGASWRGVIDDVRIYAHVLSPEQIAAMYNGGSGNNNVIVSQEIAAGDTWQCEVTPFSNSEKGGTQPSNPVTIASRVPDINGDGDVDGDDLHLFMLTFNLLSGNADFDYRCDFNMDEIVDLLDFGEIASKFGSVNP